MIKKRSVLLICKHKFMFQYKRKALLMALKQFKLRQVSLHPPQNNSKKSNFNFDEKKESKEFLRKPKMFPVCTEAAVRRGYIKKMFFKNFVKFIGKQIYRISFFDRVAGLQAATLLSKKRLPCNCFPVNFSKFLRAPFLQNTFRRRLLSTQRIFLKPNKEAIRRCSM